VDVLIFVSVEHRLTLLRKLCAKWLLRMLTSNQKQQHEQRMDDSEQFLAIFIGNKDE
jgi:hypothetical protein